MKSFIQDSFNILNKNYNYCILRNFKKLPDEIGNDIDILVQKNQLEAITNTFLKIASQKDIILIKTIRKYGYRGLYFFDKLNCQIILIDLFYVLQKRWKSYADTQFLLSKKVKFKQFNVLHPCHELYTITMKELLTYGFVREKYNSRFDELNHKDFACASENFICNNKRKVLIELIKNKKIFNPDLNYKPDLIKKKPLFNLINFFKYSFNYFYYCLINILKSSPIITLIGPDGVGKSTMANFLKSELTTSNLFSRVKIFHHRFEIIPPLSYIFKKLKNPSNEKTKELSLYQDKVHSVFRTIGYVMYYFLDYFLGWIVIFRSKLNNEAIIFDRYFFDFYIQNHYSSISTKFFDVFYFLIPKPKVIVFLYANPHVVVQRKKELTLSQHLKQNDKCLNILRNMTRNPIFINCNNTLTENKIKLIKYTIPKFFK